MNAIVAPNANSPPSMTTSVGITSANANTAAIRIPTCGVRKRRLSFPSQLGISRLVAST